VLVLALDYVGKDREKTVGRKNTQGLRTSDWNGLDAHALFRVSNSVCLDYHQSNDGDGTLRRRKSPRRGPKHL